MDLSLRLILSLVGVLIVVSILLDGLRRIRQNERLRKRDAALKTYAAPTVREKPESDEIVGAVRVRTTNTSRFSAMKEPHIGPLMNENTHRPAYDEMMGTNISEEESFEVSEPPLSREQFFVINVVSKTREGFAGSELIPAFLAAGLRFGEMSIFHRHEHSNGQGRLLFSVASLFEPGTFDLDNIENICTPGLSFFMCLPGPTNPLAAFNMMAQTAKRIAEALDGELRDRAKNPLTAQAMADSQKDIREWMKQHQQAGVAATSD